MKSLPLSGILLIEVSLCTQLYDEFKKKKREREREVMTLYFLQLVSVGAIMSWSCNPDLIEHKFMDSNESVCC